MGMTLTDGKCFYTSHNITRGSGSYHILNDGRLFLVKSKKIWTYYENRVKPQKIRYTFLSRLFYKKDQSVSKEKKEKIKIDKRTSYPMISKEKSEQILNKK